MGGIAARCDARYLFLLHEHHQIHVVLSHDQYCTRCVLPSSNQSKRAVLGDQFQNDLQHGCSFTPREDPVIQQIFGFAIFPSREDSMKYNTVSNEKRGRFLDACLSAHGRSKRQIAEELGIGIGNAYRIWSEFVTCSKVEAVRKGGSKRKLAGETVDWLKRQLLQQPTLTMQDCAQLLLERTGHKFAPSIISHRLSGAGWRLKGITTQPTVRDDAVTKRKRQEWVDSFLSETKPTQRYWTGSFGVSMKQRGMVRKPIISFFPGVHVAAECCNLMVSALFNEDGLLLSDISMGNNQTSNFEKFARDAVETVARQHRRGPACIVLGEEAAPVDFDASTMANLHPNVSFKSLPRHSPMLSAVVELFLVWKGRTRDPA